MTSIYIGYPHTGDSSREQAALFTYVHVSMRWKDVVPPLVQLPFLSGHSLKQRYACHSVTLLVRETAEDDQESTNDVLLSSCCVTFDHVHTTYLVAIQPNVCGLQ